MALYSAHALSSHGLAGAETLPTRLKHSLHAKASTARCKTLTLCSYSELLILTCIMHNVYDNVISSELSERILTY